MNYFERLSRTILARVLVMRALITKPPPAPVFAEIASDANSQTQVKPKIISNSDVRVEQETPESGSPGQGHE